MKLRTVKGPGPERVSTRSAAVTAPTRPVNPPFSTAMSTMVCEATDWKEKAAKAAREATIFMVNQSFGYVLKK